MGPALLSVAQPQLSYLSASDHWFFRWWHRYWFLLQALHRHDLTGLFCTDSIIVNKLDHSDPPHELWLVFQSGKNYGYLGQNASGEKNLKSLREFFCLFRIANASPLIARTIFFDKQKLTDTAKQKALQQTQRFNAFQALTKLLSIFPFGLNKMVSQTVATLLWSC